MGKNEEDPENKVGVFRDADLSRIAKGIIDSYHYETDFLSELLQNAVDSLRVAGRSLGNEIKVKFNAPQGLWSVEDNGTGMNEKDLKLFALGRTDKVPDLTQLLIGEKGVGGSYVLLISDYFEIETVKDGKKVKAVCENARDDLYNDREPEIIITVREDVKSHDYTKISVKSSEFKAYNNVDELISDLRMTTAVGNTKVPFEEEDLQIRTEVSIVKEDEQGKLFTKSREAEFCFLHPSVEHSSKTITFEELEEDPNASEYEDGEFDKKLFAILDKDRKTGVHINAIFGKKDLLKKLGIPSTIVLGVKGSPMPVEIKHPQTGYAGYWTNLFILVEDDSAKLDVGRKTIQHGDKVRIGRRLKKVFNNKVLKYAKLFIPPKEIPLRLLDQLKDQARNKEDLNMDIPYKKIPTKGEELSVVGIFHELIGNGVLEGYQMLSESVDAPYDGILRYTIKISDLGSKAREKVKKGLRKIKQKPDHYTQEGFVEYKVDATSFMRDCDLRKKKIEEVMLLVAYDLNKKRIRKGWSVGPIKEEERIFNGAKFKLTHTAMGRDVPVIILKEFRFSESKTK